MNRSNIVDETAAVVERLRAMQSRVDEVAAACRDAVQAWERIAAAVNAPFRTPMANDVKRGWEHCAQHRVVLGKAADLLERLSRERGTVPEGAAYWTHEECDAAGHLYYFGIAEGVRTRGPYTNQRHVDAIIDIASDGTLAGVELIDNMPPPPLSAAPQPPSVSLEIEPTRGDHD
jgi:hypothetical protein